MVFSLGSVANFCQTTFDNIPTTISGARLIDISYGQQKFCENIIGTSIGSVDIDEKYWSVLTKLTSAELCSYLEVQGADVSSIKLDVLSVSKGSSSNLASVKADLKASAIQELNRGRMITVPYYKAYG